MNALSSELGKLADIISQFLAAPKDMHGQLTQAVQGSLSAR
jgi:hypothetical protein